MTNTRRTSSICRTTRHAAPPMSAGNEPPLRRGPLRGHTQHARGDQSVLRGPHLSARKETASEGVGSDHHHHHRSESSAFGNGL